MKKVILTTILGLALAGCIESQKEFEHILRLENRRVSCDSLVKYLDSSEPKIRARAVDAMGKLQDRNCLEFLTKMLDDLNHNVRMQAAFALGQLSDPTAEDALIAALSDKELSKVKIRILEALSKIGTSVTFPVLIKSLKSENEHLRGEAALALGRMARRELIDKAASDSLTLLVADKSSDVRWKACYALAQIAKDLDIGRLRNAVYDKNPLVRMYAIQALGKLKNLTILEPLGAIIKNDPDWRVRVKAANALANYPLSLVANYFSLLNQNSQVRLAIIQALGISAQLEPDGYRQNSREHNFVKHQLEQIFLTDDGDDTWSSAEVGTALISYAKLIKKESIDLLLKFKNHADHKVRARVMTALGETGSPTIVRIFAKEYPDAPTVAKIAMLEALDKIKDFSNPKLLLRALSEKDPVLVAVAAQGLSQDTLRNRIHAQRIVQAYQNLSKPVDSESAKMIFEAIGALGDKQAVSMLREALNIHDKALSGVAADALFKITGVDYSDSTATFTTPHSDFRYKDILRLKGASALIKTPRGNIEFALFTEEAPLTVLNFVELVEQGFFDKLSFHRVVPNFVIQGGDPRGDSWGSPGYAIRSEFNMRPYLRGTVGMASAGKDTEGCQFFITHSPQPHLDGRYTVFGQVTAGMDIVDAIQEGDVMEVVAIKK